MSMVNDGFGAHLGFGKRRFEKVLRSTSFDNAYPFLNGLYAGLHMDMLAGRAMLEYDGKDLNFGYLFRVSPYFEINMAFTEMLVKSNVNENYNNAPKRSVALGFTLKQNIFTSYKKKDAVLDKAFDKMHQENTRILRQQELHEFRFKKLKDERNLLMDSLKRFSEEMNSNQNKVEEDEKITNLKYLNDISSENVINSPEYEEVVRLYTKSFEAYSQSSYFESIGLLERAIFLKPELPLLYERLGGVYFKMEQFDKALFNWKKAYSLNPYNNDLKKAIQHLENL